MKTIQLLSTNKQPQGSIQLPASKSISNRLLILQAVSRQHFEIENLSDAEDTRILQKALTSQAKTIHVGHAGTAMRFLTAYFAATGEEKILTGSKRMQERPIGELVNALRELGAEIEYLEKESFPPLKIDTQNAKGGKVKIAGNISSQFISALLMIAPLLEYGLELHIQGDLVSKPYVEMTLNLMEQFGWRFKKQERSFEFLPTAPDNYRDQLPTAIVEHDWTAASYWYSLAALSDSAEIHLKDLKQNSIQGDAIIEKWMEKLGIETRFDATGAIIKKSGRPQNHLHFDFTENPDLAQTIIALCAALDVEAEFTGLKTLRIKETDRIAALQNELQKFGKKLTETDGRFYLAGKFKPEPQLIKTYKDHRMAMAFAPLVLKCGELEMENPEVVGKSYPGFWEEVNKIISTNSKVG